jgi:hypothetical protein
MFTGDALLWRVKYFLALVAIFAATSFAPASTHCDDAPPAPADSTAAPRDSAAHTPYRHAWAASPSPRPNQPPCP